MEFVWDYFKYKDMILPTLVQTIKQMGFTVTAEGIESLEMAEALQAGIAVSDITFVDGTVYRTRDRSIIYDAVELPAFESVQKEKRRYAESFYLQYQNTDAYSGKRLMEAYPNGWYVVQNPHRRIKSYLSALWKMTVKYSCCHMVRNSRNGISRKGRCSP